MEAIETLKREHRLAARVCAICGGELDRADEAGAVDVEEIDRVVEFFRFFLAAVHDPKEEDLLFTMLHHKGLAWDEEPLARLVREHEELRVTMDGATGWLEQLKTGEQSAAGPLCGALRAWTDLALDHMRREEEGVFVLALATLTEADHDELTLAFENVACDQCDEGADEYYDELVRELASREG